MPSGYTVMLRSSIHCGLACILQGCLVTEERLASKVALRCLGHDSVGGISVVYVLGPVKL